MSDTGEEDQVGYKKPPRKTRFKKGTSGNPSGLTKAPTQPIQFGDIVEKVSKEKLEIRDNGRTKRVSMHELEYRQTVARAMRGDMPSMRLIIRLAIDYKITEPRPINNHEFIGETEAERRFGPNWPQRVDDENKSRGYW